MEQNKTIEKRRFGVIIMILSLIGINIFFEYSLNEQSNMLNETGLFISIILFITSMTLSYIKTGLWKFTHKPLKFLDEREIILTSRSLRAAYSIFTITLLVVLLFFSFYERSLNIVLVISFILFAHLLPASVIAWSEKHFSNER